MKNPLASRKVRAYLVGILAALTSPLLARCGLTDEEVKTVALAIVALAATLMMGTAIEDHGLKSAGGHYIPPLDDHEFEGKDSQRNRR